MTPDEAEELLRALIGYRIDDRLAVARLVMCCAR